jgi:hypothetical protein
MAPQPVVLNDRNIELCQNFARTKTELFVLHFFQASKTR